MKGKYIILPGMFLLGVVMGSEVNAQNNNQSIVIQKEYSQRDTSSVEPMLNWGGEFDLSDIQNLHEKIDSLFRQMNGGMDMSAGFPAFDSLPGMFKGFGDFDQLMDSSFMNELPMLGDERRLEDMVKHFNVDPNDSVFLKQHPDMDVNVKTDTIIKDGSKTIVQKITINSNNSKDLADLGGYFDSGIRMDNEVTPVQKEKAPNEIESSGQASESCIEDITLQDAEILNKGGISSKLIVAPALKPNKQDVKVVVDKKKGKEVNNVCLSVRFDGKATTELLILDNNGNTVYEEKKKNFDGKLSHSVEVESSSAPYYFLVVRNNQLYGKKILDID